MGGKVCSDLETEEMRRWKALAQLGLLRPLPDDDLGTGQIERQECFDVLLNRDPAGAEKDGSREIENGGIRRGEGVGGASQPSYR
jgi:hypothetical protein